MLVDIMILMDRNVLGLSPHKKKELEHKVREIINKVTCSKYISQLSVDYDAGMYILEMGMNCREAKPLVLGLTGTEDQFLKFIEKEFRKRQPQRVEYTSTTIINGNSDVFYPIIEL